MNRGRLGIRLALIVAAAVIFYSRGYQHNPRMLKIFGFALAFALIMVVVRGLIEASKRKKMEQEKQLASDSKNVDLFTKPRDF